MPFLRRRTDGISKPGPLHTTADAISMVDPGRTRLIAAIDDQLSGYPSTPV